MTPHPLKAFPAPHDCSPLTENFSGLCPDTSSFTLGALAICIFYARGDLRCAGYFYVCRIYILICLNSLSFGSLRWWEDSQVGKAMRTGSGVWWAGVPALPPFCCATVDKALALAEPRFPCKHKSAAAPRDAVRVPGTGVSCQEKLPCILTVVWSGKVHLMLDAVNTSCSQSRRK